MVKMASVSFVYNAKLKIRGKPGVRMRRIEDVMQIAIPELTKSDAPVAMRWKEKVSNRTNEVRIDGTRYLEKIDTENLDTSKPPNDRKIDFHISRLVTDMIHHVERTSSLIFEGLDADARPRVAYRNQFDSHLPLDIDDPEIEKMFVTDRDVRMNAYAKQARYIAIIEDEIYRQTEIPVFHLGVMVDNTRNGLKRGHIVHIDVREFDPVSTDIQIPLPRMDIVNSFLIRLRRPRPMDEPSPIVFLDPELYKLDLHDLIARSALAFCEKNDSPEGHALRSACATEDTSTIVKRFQACVDSRSIFLFGQSREFVDAWSLMASMPDPNTESEIDNEEFISAFTSK